MFLFVQVHETSLVEIRYCKNLVKLKRVTSGNKGKQAKGCLAPQLPPAQEVRQQTTGLCGHRTIYYIKLIILKYFSLPFTLLEPNLELYLSQIQIYICV